MYSVHASDFEQLEGTDDDDINTGCSLLAVKSNGHNRHEKENVLVSVMSFVQSIILSNRALNFDHFKDEALNV